MANSAGEEQRLAAGWQAIERNDPRAAENLAREVLSKNGAQIEFVRLLGASLFLQERYQEALAPFREVFQKARTSGAGYHLGYCYLALKDPRSASEVLEQVVREFPRMAPAENLLGNALAQLGCHEEALLHFEKATELDPADPQARNNLGNALIKLRRTDAAVASYRKAIELAPDYPMALANLAAALVEQNRNDEALACCRKALALDPKHVNAHINMGLAYHGLNRLDEAIASLQRALAIDPGHFGALLDLGTAFLEQGRLEEAAGHFRKVIALDQTSADAHHNLGIALQGLARHDEAIASFREALKLDPEHKYTPGVLLWSELLTYRWDTLEPEAARLRAGVRRGKSLTEPFTLIAVSEELEEQKLCGALFFEDRIGSGRVRLSNGERRHHPKIRVAYLSGDFREHAVAHCIAEVLELHDRSQFEVIGASFGVDDRSEIRARLLRGFDRFLEMRMKGDLEAAKLLRQAEADIVVDLMGYTVYSRPGILAHRPAPVQVGYLGYPGTVGADFLDYILADRFVIPQEHQVFYSERIACLPDSYQANDSKREISASTPTRAEVGLPESGFVFCCFNNSYKVVPKVFDIWMRLLRKVPGSVLWMLEGDASSGERLRKEAQARDVDPGRLVFAQRVSVAEYRARCRLADLFLDTLPYNGHGTTGDMLWSGLPVLSCAGRTFAGRVAGSLLRAAGLPELVTSTLEDYEALALKLARERGLLAELRARLQRNRNSAALFDTGRFRRHLESAYRTMWETSQRGEPPRSFAVEPIE